VKIVEVIAEADPAYEKGKAFGRRLVTPSEWFKSNKQDTVPTKDVTPTPTSSKEVNTGQLRNVVNSLLRDEPRYNEDLQLLKNLYSSLKTGKYNTSVNATELMQTIKTAYKGGQLSEKDKKVLTNFLTTL
jgi:hypothetical protein